ncbi:MAG: nickel pincer cofactor biosynthesis protein LarB [Xanthobacteraceae bacterium]|nr:nickel pincer cofactor biosynthesis protein LarB [Xanthobacteraceae bacterium]
MTEFRHDQDRAARTGIPEAVLCEHKSAAQVRAIGAAVLKAGQRMLFTRLTAEMFAALPTGLREALDYDPDSNTAFLGAACADQAMIAGIGIVAAGTSDLPVAREAARTLAFHGYAAPLTADVGVTGLWRLTEQLTALRQHRVIIAVAGMEGALFTVLAGLVEAPVIAVASSVGYGVAAGGRVALSVALASCAPGVVAVNIDNGFGAATAAIKILRSGKR